MPNINITVADKIATNMSPGVNIVCGNSDYTIMFSFDGEWDEYPIKTARFVYTLDGKVTYKETVFAGSAAPVPVLSNVMDVYVGVYAGELHTTTPARVLCDRSILCGGGVHEEPPEDVYTQILELCNTAIGATAGHLVDKNNPHGVTAAQVGAAPASHVQERNNPHGVTAAQVGAVSKTLLWENASPHSNFQRQQIYLPIADYDAVEVTFFTSSSGTDGRHIAQSFYTDTNTDYITVTRGLLYWVQGSDERTMSRDMDISTTGGSGKGYVEFYDGYSSIHGMYNDMTIPVRIYGIKGVQ